jgi:hypothetical protein
VSGRQLEVEKIIADLSMLGCRGGGAREVDAVSSASGGDVVRRSAGRGGGGGVGLGLDGVAVKA